MNNSVQRKASKHEDGVDLISNLPDPLLLLILSGLPSTEEQIRTSILSRRWRSVDLDCFRLSGWDSYRTLTVERWIHATIMKNVKQLDLSFEPKEKYFEDMVIPHCLMTCTSLEWIDDAHDLALQNLKTLELHSSIDEFTAERLIQALEYCPELESLSLTFENVISCDPLEHPKLDDAATRRILPPDVKWLEFFEFKGEKPKLVLMYENGYGWMDLVARWGKQAS
ncbi:unnamed protein product [Lactuca virosa]|uniref:F-box domain-containing protein n=1 Tax=Lactuca virosa TaxID=75947 RepID=A0AAU9NC80_9ASTR|nr:unnamed protein product [Lactuca virosa]